MRVDKAPFPFQFIFEESLHFLGLLAADGRVLTASRRALEFLARPQEAVTGRLFWDTPWWSHDPGQRRRLQQGIREAAGGRLVQMEVTALDPGGRQATFDFSLVPLGGSPGRPDWIVAEGREIKASRQAGRALEESEAKFRLLFDRSADGILLLDGDRFIDANPATLRMMGIDHQEKILESPWELSPPFQPDGRESGEKAREMIRLAHEAGFHRFEWVHRRCDGTPFPVEVTLIPIPLGGRQVLYTTWRDIRDRVEAREELAQNAERFRTVALHTGQLIYDWTLHDGRITWAGAITEITGELASDFARVGIDEWGERIHPDDSGRVFQELERVRRVCGRFHAVYRFRHRDGNYLNVEDSGAFVPGEGGAAARMLGAMSDITDRLKAEQALWQAQKLESLGVLAGGIAHDFNNLLTALLGNLNLAQMSVDGASPAGPFLANAEHVVLKAADLTRQLLAYSGKGSHIVKPHDLNRLIRELAHLLRVSISKKVHLEIRLAEGLPAVETDVAQMQQVILNLVTNGSEAIGEEVGTLAIETWSEELKAEGIVRRFPGQILAPGPFVVLEVKDTGSGMGPEVVQRIFDPFFSTKPGGRGLGLSALRGILRNHQGGIEIETAPRQGSAFRLFFPASAAPAAGEEAPAFHPGAGLAGTVLLVDDEDAVRDTAARSLKGFGLKVIEARDGREAVDLFRREVREIDCVVMDLTMPWMSGAEAFQLIRELNPDVPVLFTSGYHEDVNLKALVSRPRTRFLPKPFLVEELRRSLSEFLGG